MSTPRRSESHGSGSSSTHRTPTKAPLEVLTPAQAAKFLGVSLRTLAGWRLHNVGPAYHRLGNGPRGVVRYLRADLERFLFRNRLNTTGGVPSDSRGAKQSHEER